jgi:hypothetical protein
MSSSKRNRREPQSALGSAARMCLSEPRRSPPPTDRAAARRRPRFADILALIRRNSHLRLAENLARAPRVR